MAATPEPGFHVVADLTAGGRRAIGSLAPCVTRRLATLAEIVDWQPDDHVGWLTGALPVIGERVVVQ